MALPRERSLLDEVAASKYHVAGRIPKWEPMAMLSPFPLFRSCPEQFQSEFWGNIPFPWPVLSLLEHKCTSLDCERKEDLSLHVEEGHCPLSLHPTASNDWRQARSPALTAHTHYRKRQSYPEAQAQVGKSPCPTFPLLGVARIYRNQSKVAGAAEVINQLCHFLHCGCPPDPAGILAKPRPAIQTYTSYHCHLKTHKVTALCCKFCSRWRQ